MELHSLVFLAQQGGGGGSAGGAPNMIFFLVIIGAMFFLMYRSQKKQADERKRMLASIKVGDTVITNGGIRGVVAKVTDKSFFIKVADGVKLEVVINGVAAVEKDTSDEGKDSSKDAKKGKEEEKKEGKKGK
jgi:preprotein translocase subunit YajC